MTKYYHGDDGEYEASDHSDSGDYTFPGAPIAICASDQHQAQQDERLAQLEEFAREARRRFEARQELAAVPWKALLNIYECLTLPAVALDGDVNTLASFLNQYAPWVPNESEE